MPTSNKIKRLAADREWDAFLAIPMSTLDQEAYRTLKQDVTHLCEALQKELGWREVFCPALGLDKVNFDSPAEALNVDYAMIERCQIFLAVLPAFLPSSVIFEAGIALALQKNMIVACKEVDHIPFLMRGFPGSSIPAYGHILIYKEFSDIVAGIKKLLL